MQALQPPHTSDNMPIIQAVAGQCPAMQVNYLGRWPLTHQLVAGQQQPSKSQVRAAHKSWLHNRSSRCLMASMPELAAESPVSAPLLHQSYHDVSSASLSKLPFHWSLSIAYAPLQAGAGAKRTPVEGASWTSLHKRHHGMTGAWTVLNTSLSVAALAWLASLSLL